MTIVNELVLSNAKSHTFIGNVNGSMQILSNWGYFFPDFRLEGGIHVDGNHLRQVAFTLPEAD
jgi:hypothetical protein